MLVIRSVLYNLYLYSLTVVMAIGWLPLALFGPRETTLMAFRFWSAAAFWGLKVICATTFDIRGQENLPADRPVIIASKHQSMWDILVFYGLVRNPAFISKKEILMIPIAGYYAWRSGTIGLDRGAAAKALKKLIADAGNALGKGRSLIIFPEGTRKAPGADPDYKPGVAALYMKLDHAVVPVALNSGLYWPRRKLLRWPGTIVLEFLPAIEPGLKRREFMERLESSVEEASTRLLDVSASK